jgi:recombination protein RecA
MPRKKETEPTTAVDRNPITNAIDAVIGAIDKEFGAGSIGRLGDKGIYPEIKTVISTGITALDAAIGVGGFPLGKLIEVIGPESSGKTTLCKHLAARAQMQGIVPIVLDVEQSGVLAFDQELGIEADFALGSQPDTMEDVFKYTDLALRTLIKKKVPGQVIWDSVAATPLASELERGYDEEGRMAERAGFLSRNLKKLVALLSEGDVGLVFVNQLREKIGAAPWQKQTYSPGGRALRHYAHVRIEMTPQGFLKQGDTAIGIKTRAKVIKNKVAPPYKEAELEIHWKPPRVVEAGKPIRQPVIRG